MIGKVSTKREELALQWNTRIEVATRLLILGFSVLGMFMGFFLAAGCAMSFNYIKNITGLITHQAFETQYIIAGVIGLIISLFFFAFIGVPYLRLRRATSFKPWIITSTVFTLFYYLFGIVVIFYFWTQYNYHNNYLIIALIGFIICPLVIIICYALLWREVGKQWKLRKVAEYLQDEKSFRVKDEKLKRLEQERLTLIEQETYKYEQEKLKLENLHPNDHILNQETVVNEAAMVDVDVDNQQ
ncbi:hypothetical protein [Spiroplasma eriocheiris]|uniref:Transmembrane protein n=1 Tax=Spiroplasma eriocheiris TaxID=315358 RepID=A0A0H3XJD3_9MOLU|nr:hypothetical protein [Spiroplasma eriocheiris]AHF57479.1 putative transmembrane protein [Spiroplasma eriocheiris CCTCC M 207170]AKM53936.1 hypothetical protein SERIO_v1c03540 [Spiroplasma eriocheiris]